MTTSTPDSDAGLELLLARVPGWGGRARVVGALDGGITNRNLLVDVEGERFVLRLAGADTHLLEIDRHTERDANTRAAALGFAPDVVAFIEPEGYLVTRFVAGTAISAPELSDPARLEQIAAMLRSFHESGPLPTSFDGFVVPGLHRNAAATRGVPIPDAYWSTAAIVEEIAAAFAAAPTPRCACHNDLLNANFLQDGERIWLLDWEYAGMNDRYFDLGNLAINNGAQRRRGRSARRGLLRRRDRPTPRPPSAHEARQRRARGNVGTRAARASAPSTSTTAPTPTSTSTDCSRTRAIATTPAWLDAA